MLLEALGVANLRRGEIDNCLIMSSPDRCLFPLRPGGVHHNPEGARRAGELFEEYLKTKPDDLEVRWLLNVAYMLQGRYPAEVPPPQLLKPDLFRSDLDMPRFIDIARPARLGRDDAAGGTIVEDFDGDGLLDVFFTSVNYCSPAGLFRNRGDGTFEDISDGRRADSTDGRAERDSDRLQQRRPAGHLRDARRLGSRHAQFAPAEQSGWHVHRRHARGRPFGREELDAFRCLGGLR